ncbi:MAG: hypothetical protein JW855_04630 [Gammaproteobacteria bacterium]|nr:hypothetical protein [Gammaproteobacteria bacterium]
MTLSIDERVEKFYNLLSILKSHLGGYRKLGGCTGKMNWPDKGVYYFFNPNEKRRGDEQLRVVRVGTHATIQNAQSTLWGRLIQHRGTLSGKYAGGGNHRGSVFRRHVGDALMNRDGWPEFVQHTWGVRSSAESEIRKAEHPYEQKVSDYLGDLFVLWLRVEGSESHKMRSYIERNSISLLCLSEDRPSESWLGNFSSSDVIRKSGLWNVNHVGESVDTDFLSVFSNYVKMM